jgi:hypothetical protein
LYEDGSAEYPKQAPVGKGIGEEVCKWGIRWEE